MGPFERVTINGLQRRGSEEARVDVGRTWDEVVDFQGRDQGGLSKGSAMEMDRRSRAEGHPVGGTSRTS